MMQFIGAIDIQLEEYEDAKQQFEKCLIIVERLDDLGERATTLRLLGDVTYLQEKYEESQHFYETILTIPEQHVSEKDRANILYSLGSIAWKKYDYAVALGYLVQILMNSESLTPSLRDSVLSSIEKLRAEMGEGEFTVLWQQINNGRSQPDLAIVDRPRDLSLVLATWKVRSQSSKSGGQFPKQCQAYRRGSGKMFERRLHVAGTGYYFISSEGDVYALCSGMIICLL